MQDRAQDEAANGHLWRAKEILRGRIAAAAYDPALFERYADVLAAMHDDDEAGRFYLLAGKSEGNAGALARAFLARRARRTFAQLWSEMPAAASRSGREAVPAATVQLLASGGFDVGVIRKHLADQRLRSKANRERRKKLRVSVSDMASSERIGLVMAAILLVVLTVGVIGTVRLIWWGIFALFG